MNNAFTDLGLTASTSGARTDGGCCGGGECACGATSSVAVTHASSATVTHASSATFTRDFLVTGMTCAHCVSSVTEEIGDLDGVEAVAVELNVGAASKVRVSASGPLDVDRVRAAVADAGYELVGSPA